jgi:hypothetical protein
MNIVFYIDVEEKNESYSERLGISRGKDMEIPPAIKDTVFNWVFITCGR